MTTCAYPDCNRVVEPDTGDLCPFHANPDDMIAAWEGATVIFDAPTTDDTQPVPVQAHPTTSDRAAEVVRETWAQYPRTGEVLSETRQQYSSPCAYDNCCLDAIPGSIYCAAHDEKNTVLFGE